MWRHCCTMREQPADSADRARDGVQVRDHDLIADPGRRHILAEGRAWEMAGSSKVSRRQARLCRTANESFDIAQFSAPGRFRHSRSCYGRATVGTVAAWPYVVLHHEVGRAPDQRLPAGMTHGVGFVWNVA
jgi:hypothetical protein